ATFLPARMNYRTNATTLQRGFTSNLRPRSTLGSCGPLLHRQRVPDTYGAIARPRDQPCAVGAEGDLVDIRRVTVQFRNKLVLLHVPKSNHIVGAGTGESRAVRAKGHAINNRAMPQDGDLLPGGGVPEANRAVL